jgi:hypothetical protein
MRMHNKFSLVTVLILTNLLTYNPVLADDPEPTPATPATSISMFIPFVAGGEDSPTQPSSGSIVVNHTSVNLFDRIPPRYLTACSSQIAPWGKISTRRWIVSLPAAGKLLRQAAEMITTTRIGIGELMSITI